jgi:hypothetical protein
MKPKIIYEESYRQPWPALKDEYLPDLKHLNKGAKVVGAQVMRMGVMERDGRQVEFSDIRVYIDVNEVKADDDNG